MHEHEKEIRDNSIAGRGNQRGGKLGTRGNPATASNGLALILSAGQHSSAAFLFARSRRCDFRPRLIANQLEVSAKPLQLMRSFFSSCRVPPMVGAWLQGLSTKK